MTSPIRLDPRIVSPLERGRIGGASFEPGAGEPSFADAMKRVLNDTSTLQDDAQGIIGSFLRGEHVEVHQVMAASEEAAISLEFLVELRNKLTDAYRSVMNTQT